MTTPGEPPGPLGAQLRQAPDLEDIVDLECRLCPGLVDRVTLHEVRTVARDHLHTLHPIEVAALRATTCPDQLDQALSRHWQGRAAVPVCDTCYSILEPPYWDHTSTPPTRGIGTLLTGYYAKDSGQDLPGPLRGTSSNRPTSHGKTSPPNSLT